MIFVLASSAKWTDHFSLKELYQSDLLRKLLGHFAMYFFLAHLARTFHFFIKRYVAIHAGLHGTYHLPPSLGMLLLT